MSAQLSESKQRLRAAMAERRRAISRQEAAEAARVAADSLVASDEFRRARRVGVYAALPDELPSRDLFDAVIHAGATALFPRTLRDGPLEFSRVERWEELIPGAYGVLEPPPGAPVTAFEPTDVVVVPGVAFDEDGFRLGRGKAYYDRTFPEPSEEGPVLMGYGYEFQIVDAVPRASWDRRMNAIVTERAVRRCGES